MVFDENGEQMSNVQSSYLEMYLRFLVDQLQKMGQDNDIDNMEFIMPDSTVMTAEKHQERYIFKIKRD